MIMHVFVRMCRNTIQFACLVFISMSCVYKQQMLVWPHEVKPRFHSWYRGRVETLDAKYNQLSSSL